MASRAQIEGARVQADGLGTIYVIDDDGEVRTALSFLLRSMNAHSWPFAGGRDFLDGLDGLSPGLVLLDMRMPDPDGLGVLRELRRRNINWPVIAITGHGDVKLAVNAMKLGAFDFLEKPIEDEDLGSVLERGFAELCRRRAARERMDAARSRLDTLTAREIFVLKAIVEGKGNKEIASAADISVRTVEMHRQNLIKKLGVRNTAEAAACAVEAGLVASEYERPAELDD